LKIRIVLWKIKTFFNRVIFVPESPSNQLMSLPMLHKYHFFSQEFRRIAQIWEDLKIFEETSHRWFDVITLILFFSLISWPWELKTWGQISHFTAVPKTSFFERFLFETKTYEKMKKRPNCWNISMREVVNRQTGGQSYKIWS
jgi:hypothetical protein